VAGALTIAFSAILERKPDWADAYLGKADIKQLMPLLRSVKKDDV
jgi:hypothetical protein